jgi:hypothetical protein
MMSRQGKPKAITTTAHKLVKVINGLIKNGKEYVTKLVATEEAKKKDYLIKKLKKAASELGAVVTIEGQVL